MRTFTDSAYQQPAATGNQAYSASVPLSVYRELAAEQQATQAAIHQHNQQNEHLAQENHVLRQEIAKTVNAVIHLQNAVNYSANAAYSNTVNTSFNQTLSSETREKRQTSGNKQYRHQNVPPKRVKRPRPPAPHQVTEYFEPLPEPVFIEEEQASYYYEDESELSQVSGWWLIFAIVTIIVMGFGAGYVVVRPLLENHTR